MRRCSSKIYNDYRAAIQLIRSHCIDQTVGTQCLWFRNCNIDSSLDAWCNNNRLNVQILDDTTRQRVHNLRYNGRDNNRIDL